MSSLKLVETPRPVACLSAIPATVRPATLPDPRVLSIKSRIRSQMHRRVTLPELARQEGISVSRLSHLFKAHTGMPLVQYLKRLRMETARRLLETTPLKIKEISAHVGMLDFSHFVRDFERAYGLSPARYRCRFLYEKLGASSFSDQP